MTMEPNSQPGIDLESDEATVSPSVVRPQGVIPGRDMFHPPTQPTPPASVSDEAPIQTPQALPFEPVQVPLPSISAEVPQPAPQLPAAPTTFETIVPDGSKLRVPLKQQLRASLIVVGFVLLLTAAVGGISRFWNLDTGGTKTVDRGIVEQDLVDTGLIVQEPSTIDYQLSGEALVVQGDVVSNGSLKLYDGTYLATISQASPTTNRKYGLPDADGTFCLSSNNCAYVTTAGLADLQGEVATLETATEADIAALEAAVAAGADIILGTGTSGDYIASLGTLLGLGVIGNSGEGSTPALSVLYGSTTGTAVQGDTSLICPSGNGNLTGGGTSITLGNGGTCASLSTVASPSFTSVTLSSALGISSGGTGAASAQAAINGISGLTTNGDLLYHNGTNATRLARGSNGLCLTSTTTTLAWGGCSSASAIINGGNGFGAVATIGTNDNFGLNLEVNNSTVASFTNTGQALFKNASDSATAFRIQTAASESFLTADSITKSLVAGDLRPQTVASSNGFVITSLDTGSSSGHYSSMAFGSDGFARISYHAQGTFDLKFIRCTNTTCSSQVITSVDTTGSVGEYTSMALGADGFARISYFDNTNTNLKFAQCTNADCSTSVLTTVDATGFVGDGTSMALGADGFARIAYLDSTNTALKFIQCLDASCSTRSFATVDNASDVGYDPSMVLGSDGFARIAYRSWNTGELKFAQCTNAACSTSVITSLDTGGMSNTDTAIALGADGFARIAYFLGGGINDLKYVQCLNASCSSNVITTVDSTGDMGREVSVVIGVDGFARMSYYDNTNFDLKYARCTNATCSMNKIHTLDSSSETGRETFIALAPDGNPRISYRYQTGSDLRFLYMPSDNPDKLSGTNLGKSTEYFGDLYVRNGTLDQLLVKPTTNSLTALQIQNATGSVIFNADTINSRIGVGTSSPQDSLHIAGGQIRIDNDADGTNKGCFRFNGTLNRMQFSHDCTTFQDIGSSRRLAFVRATSYAGGSYAGGALAKVDATNLQFTFTAPSSGEVVVIANVNMEMTGAGHGRLAIIDNANAQVHTHASKVVQYGDTSGNPVPNDMAHTYRYTIDGLTPGTSYTWYLGWSVTGGTIGMNGSAASWYPEIEVWSP